MQISGMRTLVGFCCHMHRHMAKVCHVHRHMAKETILPPMHMAKETILPYDYASSDTCAYLSAYVQRPEFALRFLVPGRVVRVVEGLSSAVEGAGMASSVAVATSGGNGSGGSSAVDMHAGKGGGVDWGWGVVLGFAKQQQERLESEECEEGEVVSTQAEPPPDETSADSVVVYVLLPAVEAGDAEAGAGGGGGGRKRRTDSDDAVLDREDDDAALQRLSPYFGAQGMRGAVGAAARGSARPGACIIVRVFSQDVGLFHRM